MISNITNSENPAHGFFNLLKPYFDQSEEVFFTDKILNQLYSKADPAYLISNTPIEAIRAYLASVYSCAIPSDFLLKEIAKECPLIEVGAGSGYWANLLQKQGAEIVAFDSGVDYVSRFFDVQTYNHDTLCAHKDKTLLLIWPSDGLSWASEVLRSQIWKKVIYIGETRGGRMADSSFFDILDEKYKLEKSFSMPNYPGWNDRFFVYKLDSGIV
jgi:hypothetical protein